MYVSGNFFRVLGVQPALGRGFLESEDQAVGRDAVVVLGHDYWVSQFNANPSVVGSTIWINSVPCTVIGVTPQQFTGVDQMVKPTHVRSTRDVSASQRRQTIWRNATCAGSR